MDNNEQGKLVAGKAHWKLAAGFIVPMAMMAGIAQAATVHLVGPDIDFYYDDTQAGLAYFGPPQVSATGNNLIFAPTGFNAQSIDGVGSHTGSPTDAMSASFTFRAIARTTATPLETVIARELGDYRMSSTAPDNTFVSVGSILTVVETTNITNESFTEFLSSSDLTIADGNFHAWESTGTVDLTSPNWSGVGDVLVTLQNNLTAGSAGAGDSAFIQKAIIGEGIVVSMDAVVPVPAAVWLFGSGLMGLVGVARVRRNRA